MYVRIATTAALTVAGLASAVAPAVAADIHPEAPHSVGKVSGTLVNGDVVSVDGDVLSDICVPVKTDLFQVLVDQGPTQACQEVGGLQPDAPQADIAPPSMGPGM